MKQRVLGQQGLEVSEIGLGCGSPTFAGRLDEAGCLSIIDCALDLGINYFDTA